MPRKYVKKRPLWYSHEDLLNAVKRAKAANSYSFLKVVCILKFPMQKLILSNKSNCIDLCLVFASILNLPQSEG